MEVPVSQKIRDAAIGISFLIASLAFAYSQVFMGPHAPRPNPAIDAVGLGREFSPKLATCLADGFEAGASVLESPEGSVAAAIEKQKAVFADNRAAAFEKSVGPAFALLVPDGKEPEARSGRVELAQAWRDFARGLRGKR